MGKTKLGFSGDIATITIDNFRPVRLTRELQQINTLDDKIFLEINQRLDEIETGGRTRTVVFTGIHPERFYPVFCDGIDLTLLAGLKFMDFGEDMGREIEIRRIGIDTLNRIARMNAYFIARLNGVCIGGGLELALGCDYLLSLPKMLIGLPEIKYGITPGWNGLQSLAHKIGKEKALDLYFEGFFEPSGKPVVRNGIRKAEEAKELGIVDEIVPSLDEMDRRIVEIAKEFNEGSRPRRSKPEHRVYKTLGSD